MTALPSLLGPDGVRRLCGVAADAPPGAFVEIGVYQGGSALALYQLAQAQGRALYLYDTFAGHPHHDDALDDHPLGRFSDAIDPAELQRLLPAAVVVVGTFPDSLVEMPPVAFVHADADIYESTRAICERMPPLMVKGGLILYDDFSHHDCRGCRVAVDEAFPDRVVVPGGQALVTLP